ncbi:MAG TPA: DUF4835 family protein, partial [Terriglobia bacterium]|nr:DUF4835 family protein [Terriglobia bacterium]
MKNAVLCILLLLAVHLPAAAQELNCRVTVNVDNIASSNRDYLRSFKSDIERYLNGTRFTNEDLYGDKINASIDIFFTQVTGNNRYKAEAVIASTRPIYVGNDESDSVSQVLRLKDTQWEFPYVPNQRIYFDEYAFDPLTSFLNYYAYIVIGFDLGTYKPLDGARVFQKALNVSTAALSSPFASDWQSNSGYSRSGLAQELTNPRNQPILQAYYNYHFNGIDLLATETRKGLDNMLDAIAAVYNIRQQNPTSLMVKIFFDAKAKEIAKDFASYPDASVFDKLA